MVKGKEHIVTMNSGVYGWHGDDRLRFVHKFDGRGAPAPSDFVTTVGPAVAESDAQRTETPESVVGGVRTQLDLGRNETAVIEPIPARLSASSPVNVRVLHHDYDTMQVLLNGQGAAKLELYAGSSWPDWRNPDGYSVTIGETTQTLVVSEDTGLLTVPLELKGQVKVMIARVVEDIERSR